MRLSEYEQRQLDIESGQQMDRIAAIHRRDVCFEACATIQRPEGIVEAIRVLDEEADLLLVAIGHVPGINEARKRFILAQSKALRAIGK